MINKKTKTVGISPKLSVKYKGPYILKDKLSSVLFKVTDEKGKLQDSPVQVNPMKKYRERVLTDIEEETEEEEEDDTDGEARPEAEKQNQQKTDTIKFIDDANVQQQTVEKAEELYR